ncbi:PrgI family protein [Candidatus Curtissbacteria bacterium]|nr:PrgI family protein [Candidatus Curtissbacteria bacterium]
MEQHPVPQHIAAFEFKLFGNLTIRQFVTLAIPLSVGAIIFFSNLTPVVRLPLAVIFAGFGLFAALVPINGRPFDKWIVAFIKAVTSPTQRIWVKEARLPDFLNVVIAPGMPDAKIPESITIQGRQRLQDYLSSLPQKTKTPQDKQEQIALARLGLEPQAPTSFVATIDKIPESIKVEKPYIGLFSQSLPPTQIGKTRAVPRLSKNQRAFILPGLQKKLDGQNSTSDHIQLTNIPRFEPKTRLASEMNFEVENIIPIHTPDHRIKLVPGIGNTRVRKLHFGPGDMATENLPIRGENRFEIQNTKEEVPPTRLTPQEPLQQKEEEAASISQTAPILSAGTPAVKISPTPQEPSANLRLEGSILPKPKIKIGDNPAVSLKKEEPQVIDTHITVNKKQLEPAIPAKTASPAQIVPLTNMPNVLSGLVLSAEGIPQEGAILIVHDQNGIPVRALKTNKLGQFLSSTPLPEGRYSIEIEAENGEFTPVSLTVQGKILMPIEIKAKVRV